MKKVHPSSQFKKDFKKYKRSPAKVRALEKIVSLLIEERPIPKEHKPHLLKGQYAGCMECHIEDDYLLIWIDKGIIDLLRLGSHSELFDKKRK